MKSEYLKKLILQTISENYKKHIEITYKTNKDESISYSVTYSNPLYTANSMTSLLCKQYDNEIYFRSSFSHIFDDNGISYTKNKNDQIVLSLRVVELYALFIFEQAIKELFQFNAFGCCHNFIKCSDARECIHDDLLYATACMYRKNLERGKFFYGKNRNINFPK